MSGFMLCDDIMEMVGKEVVKKREQDTLDYWIDLDFRGGNGMRASGTLDTIKYLCEGRDEIEHNMYERNTLIDYMGWNHWVERMNWRDEYEEEYEEEMGVPWDGVDMVEGLRDFEGLGTNAFEKGNVYRRMGWQE